MKQRTGIPSIGGGGPSPGLKKPKATNGSSGIKGVDQNRIKTLLQNNPSGAAATMNKQGMGGNSGKNHILIL